MVIIASKTGKIIQTTGIGLLLVMSLLSTMQVDSVNRKNIIAITSDGDETETIFVPYDRLRSRVLGDVFKKLTFLPSPFTQVTMIVCDLKSVERKSLFVNAYQRNVFYVFAFSTVP